MNTHFHQKPVMASSGGGSGVGIPGFCLVMNGNLNSQMKRFLRKLYQNMYFWDK